MKMKKYLFLAIAVFLVVAPVRAAVQTIKAEVNGMVCAFCAQGIEKKMRSLSQTKDVYVNLKQRIVAVELKDGQSLSQETVRDLVKDAGYDVTKIQVVDETAAQIRAAMKKE
jgi:periplasmic mercuric ion binding protein